MSTADLRVTLETDNHLLAAQHAAAGQTPAQLTWADLGTDLGARFAVAIEKLERLLYVIAGSPPASYAPFKDWVHRKHPRCLWIVEQAEQKWCGTRGQYGEPLCGWEYQHTEYHEYAALGLSVGIPAPTVPIRNRSADPMQQMIQAAASDRHTFPLGSVVRFPGSQVDGQNRVLFDPVGTGEFGGDPAHIGTDGPDHYNGEAVPITYKPPTGLKDAMLAGEVRLYYTGGNVQMAAAGDSLQASIPAMSHDTVVEWYLRARPRFEFSGANWVAADRKLIKPGGFTAEGFQVGATVYVGGGTGVIPGNHTILEATSDYLKISGPINLTETDITDHSVLGLVDGPVRYEPGGMQVPSTPYSYRAFTHYNPYAHGLPEMVDAWRKGTDRYLFDRSEGIQPELINMCRYILDVLGRRFYHSPQRPGVGANSGLCCAEIPIVWRWSGAGKWPLYVAGGKGGTDGVHPLHNLDEEIASPLGRASWRGVEWPYGDVLNYDSWAFPQGLHEATWLSPLEHVGADQLGLSALRRWMLSPPGDPDTCKTYWDSRGRGLQAGDVIQRVHVEEIIQAVEYLLANGLWLKVPIRRRPKTPQGTFLGGLTCGQWHSRDWLGQDTYGSFLPQLSTTCPWFLADYVTPVDYPEPDDWLDCWNSTEKYSAVDGQMHAYPFGACGIQEEHTLRAGSNDGHPYTISQTWRVLCGGSWQTWLSDQHCGYTNGFKSYESYHATYDNHCDTRARGWEAYICGPVRCPGGCDADHGNPAGWKTRNDHFCPVPSYGLVPTYRYGNCLEETFSCAGPVDAGDEHLGFQTVRAVRYQGACNNWLTWCDHLTEFGLECVHDEDIPNVAGLPGKYDWQGQHFCSETCWGSTTYPDDGGMGWLCELAHTDCDLNKQWARIDLNLGGAGYASAPDMPVLKAYHPTPVPDPTTFPDGGDPISDCPCETADPTAGPCTA